jgi:hypothetical protein
MSPPGENLVFHVNAKRSGKGALNGPSMVRFVAAPKAKEEQVLFGFVNEISLSPKKRDRDATASILQPNSSHIKV